MIGSGFKRESADIDKPAKTVGAETVGALLETLVPKSIDDIIRRHREHACLRFSTKEDLEPLASEILPTVRAVPVSLWNLITLTLSHPKQREQHVFLFGWNDNENRTWNTSPVLQLDAAAGLLVTRSGTLYRLAGPQGTEQDLNLLHLCIYLRRSGAREYFGIPAFFY